MTDEPLGRRLDPFDPEPPDWAKVRADEVVRQIFAFEPGSGGWGPAGGWGRRRATTPPVLRFSDRYIVGVLDLRAVEFPHLLEFVRCRFVEPPDLRQAKIAGCEFDSCWLPGLEGRNLYSDNDLRLVGGTRVEGRVDLTDAEISGSLELTRAQLVNVGGYALHADRLQLAGALLAANLEVRGQMRIPGLRTGGNINLSGALLDCPEGYALDGNGLHVGGNLQCVPTAERRFQAIGRLYLPSARIDSDFSLRGALAAACRRGLQRRRQPAVLRPACHVDRRPHAGLRQRRPRQGPRQHRDAADRQRPYRWVAAVVRRHRRPVRRAGAVRGADRQEPAWSLSLPGAAPRRHRDRRRHRRPRTRGSPGRFGSWTSTPAAAWCSTGRCCPTATATSVEGRRFTTGGNLDARGVVVFGSILLPEASIGANFDLRFSRLVNPGRYRQGPVAEAVGRPARRPDRPGPRLRAG